MWIVQSGPFPVGYSDTNFLNWKLECVLGMASTQEGFREPEATNSSMKTLPLNEQLASTDRNIMEYLSSHQTFIMQTFDWRYKLFILGSVVV